MDEFKYTLMCRILEQDVPLSDSQIIEFSRELLRTLCKNSGIVDSHMLLLLQKINKPQYTINVGVATFVQSMVLSQALTKERNG
jgi:hypothetical protein